MEKYTMFMDRKNQYSENFHSKIQTTGILPPWGVQIIYLFSLSPNLISSQQSSINQQGTGT